MTPCEEPRTVVIDGKLQVIYECPYEDTYCGYESEMCRNCCGLGVDD